MRFRQFLNEENFLSDVYDELNIVDRLGATYSKIKETIDQVKLDKPDFDIISAIEDIKSDLESLSVDLSREMNNVNGWNKPEEKDSDISIDLG